MYIYRVAHSIVPWKKLDGELANPLDSFPAEILVPEDGVIRHLSPFYQLRYIVTLNQTNMTRTLNHLLNLAAFGKSGRMDWEQEAVKTHEKKIKLRIMKHYVTMYKRHLYYSNRSFLVLF